MARTADELLREYIGNQVVALISLTAEVERLREALAATQSAADARTPLKPNGRDHAAPGVHP